MKQTRCTSDRHPGPCKRREKAGHSRPPWGRAARGSSQVQCCRFSPYLFAKLINSGMFGTDGSGRHSFLTLLLILVGICLGFVVVGPLVGFLCAMPFYDGSVLELAEALQDAPNHPDVKVPMYILQASAT